MSKSESPAKTARIFYARMDEHWRRGQKYAFLEEKQHVGGVEWQELQPDAKHNWLTKGMHNEFEFFLPLGGKETKGRTGAETIFQTFSNGVKTNRDRWVYNFSRDELKSNIIGMIETYNGQVYKWNRLARKPASVDEFLLNDERKLSWSGDLKEHLVRGTTVEFDEGNLTSSLKCNTD